MAGALIANTVGTRPQLIEVAPVSRALGDGRFIELPLNRGLHADPAAYRNPADGVGLRRPDAHPGIGTSSHGRQTAHIRGGRWNRRAGNDLDVARAWHEIPTGDPFGRRGAAHLIVEAIGRLIR